ncbi:SDR family NAD(P)-dependent oxidoreductase [Leptobacterium flavescens]|uniref:SDR family NAD(P)-dependent oxidoreductase n=1 Tax=Leptobacterium flavescens TaxID=472055 RepID=A0A6P0UNY3_9FLAO|nr:SDR family oxidoreductase [Leptobacterium flavescens]NER14875.1 SDR family NAD(P)-dependent oxidoreductase [Leptobacterium flavescens]
MNKTVLITGASSGIGKVTAKHFQNQGWNVIATMRSPEKEEELTKLDHVLVTKLDVLDHNSINQSVQAGIEEFGKIDVLVNNAGYGAYGPLEAFPRENIVRQFNTNVIGLLDVTRAVLPHFRKNRSGVIINISSIGGKITFPLGSLYHGTKFAVEGISESLSFELGSIGIKVKLVEPGMINTDFSGRSFDFQNNEGLAEYQPVVGAVMQGFSQAGQNSSEPEVVADVIFEAATDNNDTLRYRAGADAHQYLDGRQAIGDEAFVREMKKNFGL